MASKELIENVATSIANALRVSQGEEEIPLELLRADAQDLYRIEAKAAISTILAALQEPIEAMLDAAKDKNDGVTNMSEDWDDCHREMWRAMLAASALGEQSYRAEIISADGAVWDETAPGTQNFKRREQSE